MAARRGVRPEWHRLLSLDHFTKTGVCSRCGPTRVKANGVRDSGHLIWRCREAISSKPSEIRHRRTLRLRRQGRAYRMRVGDKCDRCGFIAEHPCQLDVDHIDGNHMNDDPSNLQTLCANCHRLKTITERLPALRAKLWPGVDDAGPPDHSLEEPFYSYMA